MVVHSVYVPLFVHLLHSIVDESGKESEALLWYNFPLSLRYSHATNPVILTS